VINNFRRSSRFVLSRTSSAMLIIALRNAREKEKEKEKKKRGRKANKRGEKNRQRVK
jgi:hypothetical protein